LEHTPSWNLAKGITKILQERFTIPDKIAIDTSDICLKLKANLDDGNWDLVVYNDSDWFRDVKTIIHHQLIGCLGFQFVGVQWVVSGDTVKQ
jgi:hypothetical protein